MAWSIFKRRRGHGLLPQAQEQSDVSVWLRSFLFRNHCYIMHHGHALVLQAIFYLSDFRWQTDAWRMRGSEKEKESVSTSREHEGCFLQSLDKERNERLMRDKMATCERLLESALFQAL